MTVIERMARAMERENWSMSAAIVGGQRIDNREMNARRAKVALSVLLEEMPEKVIEAGVGPVSGYHADWDSPYEAAQTTLRAIIQAIIEEAK